MSPCCCPCRTALSLLTAARVILQGCWVNHVTSPQLSIFLWSPSHSEEEPKSPEVRNPIPQVLPAQPLSLTRSAGAAPVSWLLLRPCGRMPTLAAHPLWVHVHSRLPAAQNLSESCIMCSFTCLRECYPHSDSSPASVYSHLPRNRCVPCLPCLSRPCSQTSCNHLFFVSPVCLSSLEGGLLRQDIVYVSPEVTTVPVTQ